MRKFVANEGVWNGFRRVANGLSGTVKSYLLKSVGLTTHDIRLFPGKSGPFWILQSTVPSDYPWYVRFNPVLCVGDIHVLNASSTTPVIIEEHVLLEVPEDVPMSILETIHGSYSYSHVKKKSACFRYSLIESLPSESSVSSLQALSTGVVIRSPQVSCAFPLSFDFISDEENRKAGNSQQYQPNEETQKRLSATLDQFLGKCCVRYGLVLNSEELMPFEWSHSDRRFVPGFATIGVVVE